MSPSLLWLPFPPPPPPLPLATLGMLMEDDVAVESEVLLPPPKVATTARARTLCADLGMREALLWTAAEAVRKATIKIIDYALYRNPRLYQRESIALERLLQATQLSHARDGGGPNLTAGKPITKASCLAGRNSRAGPALENEAF
jgi:hypothetical protein